MTSPSDYDAVVEQLRKAFGEDAVRSGPDGWAHIHVVPDETFVLVSQGYYDDLITIINKGRSSTLSWGGDVTPGALPG